MARFPALHIEPVAHLRRQVGPSSSDRRACRAPVRQYRSRAGTCRRDRTAPSGRAARDRLASASSPSSPSKRSTSPANRKVSPGRSCSMNHSSTSPSTRPPYQGACRLMTAAASSRQPHLDHLGFNDGPDIEAVLLGEPRMGKPQPAVAKRPELGIAIIALERVAAGRNECRPRCRTSARSSSAIGVAAASLRHRVISGWNGPAQATPRMCWHSTSSLRRAGGSVSCAPSIDRSPRRLAFQHLEAVRRHEQGARGLIEPVIGAADALQDAARSLRRPDIDDEVDVAPIDAEIERRGRRRRRAAFPPPSPPRPCAAASHRASRDAAQSADAASFAVHNSWKMISACDRVLTKTSAMRARSIAA